METESEISWGPWPQDRVAIPYAAPKAQVTVET